MVSDGGFKTIIQKAVGGKDHCPLATSVNVAGKSNTIQLHEVRLLLKVAPQRCLLSFI
jgi:hypothetical protein